MKKSKALLLSTILVMSYIPYSQADNVRPVFSVGYESGGETIGSFTFTDGSTENLTAGGGLSIAGGMYAPLRRGFGILATLGYKYETVNASNATIEFTRIPLEFLAVKDLGGRHDIAAGMTYHLSPTYSCSGSSATGCNRNITFDDAMGFLAEYSYSFGQRDHRGMKIGVRYTNIQYKTSTISVDGSSTGLFIHF